MGYFTKGILIVFIVKVTFALKLAPTVYLNDGNRMPAIALGTAGAKTKLRQAVEVAVKAGYRHIDTATSYHNEEYIGDALKSLFDRNIVRRENLFITTKLPNNKHAEASVVPTLRKSLQRLGLDYVDLYLIQSPMAKAKNVSLPIDYLETWKGMEEAKRLGLTKSIGVSNFNIRQLDRLVTNSQVKPSVNQIEVNPTLTQEALVSRCQQLGIAVSAFCPMGFMVPRGIDDPPPPRVNDPILVDIAEKYGKTTLQIVLRYLLDRGLAPVPKSTNKKHIIQNIGILDFQLEDDEIFTISSFNRNIRVIDSKASMDHPYYPFNED